MFVFFKKEICEGKKNPQKGAEGKFDQPADGRGFQI